MVGEIWFSFALVTGRNLRNSGAVTWLSPARRTGYERRNLVTGGVCS